MGSFEGVFACQRDSFLKEVLLIFHCFKMCVWKVQLKLSLLCKSHKSIWTCVVLEGIHRHFSKFSLLLKCMHILFYSWMSKLSPVHRAHWRLQDRSLSKDLMSSLPILFYFPKVGARYVHIMYSFCLISNDLNVLLIRQNECTRRDVGSKN